MAKKMRIVSEEEWNLLNQQPTEPSYPNPEVIEFILENVTLQPGTQRILYSDGVIGSNIHDLLKYIFVNQQKPRPPDLNRFKVLLQKLEIERTRGVVRKRKWLPIN